MRKRLGSVALAAAAAVGAVALYGAAGCIASAPEGIQRRTDGDGGGELIVAGSGGGGPGPLGPGTSDPHAVLGAAPPHGPFHGGQRVVVHGKGFTALTRVWLGDTEVDAESVVPIDAGRVQIAAPPGLAGPTALTVQNGEDASTRRTLQGGYHYDALYAAPSSGPVAGGTLIEIHGQGTSWDASTEARVDQKPCSELTVAEPTRLLCVVPLGTPGAKTVSVKTGDETIAVLDAYAYEDSAEGFKGGLSGAPLAGALKVLVYNNFTGEPVPGAYAVVGSSLEGGLVAQANATGVALFSDASLHAPRTVTVGAECHSPISFVDVPVDTVTVYLDPVLTPLCASSGDPPPVGGKPGSGGAVKGELVWYGGNEFKKGVWTNVPLPVKPEARRAAYVFLAGADPNAGFNLPPESSAVTEGSPGELGYAFTVGTGPGNRTLYAVAGIEDRSVTPATFQAYAMGVVKGVNVLPGSTTLDVNIPMTKTLDQALTMQIGAPVPGPKGPDRLRATVAVSLGSDGFAILPAGQKTTLLPFEGPLSFIGLPSLDKELFGSSYVSAARAFTGPQGSAPLSVVGRVLTTTTSQLVPMNGFVGAPTLLTPALNGAWDGRHLESTFGPGAPIDLSVYDVASGNGLIRWTVAVPAGAHAIELPDLRELPGIGLPPGPLSIGVYGARFDEFDYAKLRYRHLRPQGMTAYALDGFSAHL